MSEYLIQASTLSSLVAKRKKAARKKIIAVAHQLERDSYKAMMQRRRQLQASSRYL